MGIFTTAARAPLVARRFLVELRGIRRALERVADAAELSLQVTPSKGGQSFRGFSRERQPSDGANSSVSYSDPQEMQRAWEKQQELIPLLGRDPTAEELETALRGDIE